MTIRRKKLKDGNPNQVQQGDVLIETNPLPAHVREVDRKGVVAEGEGHHEHIFIDPAVVAQFEYNEDTYIKVTKDTELAHRVKGSESQGEHNTLKLLKGEYNHRPVLERDWLNKLNRKVVD